MAERLVCRPHDMDLHEPIVYPLIPDFVCTITADRCTLCLHPLPRLDCDVSSLRVGYFTNAMSIMNFQFDCIAFA
ncbi:hypothetical protein PENSPDRAFT_81890 [Peniophora sp. CONT]|nr:hypothetical protein PENSPDRAFT_81890 [Peniophora sp. CONT]